MICRTLDGWCIKKKEADLDSKIGFHARQMRAFQYLCIYTYVFIFHLRGNIYPGGDERQHVNHYPTALGHLCTAMVFFS